MSRSLGVEEELAAVEIVPSCHPSPLGHVLLSHLSGSLHSWGHVGEGRRHGLGSSHFPPKTQFSRTSRDVLFCLQKSFYMCLPALASA